MSRENFANLYQLINPKTIVLYGASEKKGSIGNNIFQNITEHSDFKSRNLFLVHPKHEVLFNKKCYKSCLEIETEEIDLAIIAVSADQVLRCLQDCNQKRIPYAIVMSSGFAEVGGKGITLQEELKAFAKHSGMRIYGPNTGGLTNIVGRLGLTFSPAFKQDTLQGSIGVVTQGGGMGRTIVQGMTRGIGFAYFISPGNEVDLEVSDFIYFMIQDPKVRVITVLIEGLKSPEKFKMAAQAALENNKPIVLLKVGRSELGKRAALSHTGALTGSDEVFNAVCKQYGIIRVDDVDELLEVSGMLSLYEVKERCNTVVLTVSGGAGTITADFCGMEGVPLAQLGESTALSLKSLLPGFVTSVQNPIDLTATALVDTSLHRKALSILINDSDVDVIIIPINADYEQATKDFAEDIWNAKQQSSKMIIPIWMSDMKGQGFQVLREHGVLTFRSIGSAVKALKKIQDYGRRLSYKQDVLTTHTNELGPVNADPILDGMNGNNNLDEYQSKQLLQLFGIACTKDILAGDKESALKAAVTIGYPVALKVVTPQILHKTEAGIIRLNIRNPEELSEAYDKILENCKCYRSDAKIKGVLVSEMVAGGLEMIIGLKHDPDFGPVVTFGLGGVFTEVIKDVQMALCPISKTYAKDLLSQLKGYKLLSGYRGKEMDIEALSETIQKVSIMGHQLRSVLEELDMNPLMVFPKGEGVKALDALFLGRTNE